MNRGYTKRWRKRWDKGYHTDPVLWLVMDYFIDFANYKDSEVYFPGSGMIEIKRGQHIFGSLKVSEFLNVHRSSIVRKIKLLETIGFMTVQANNKYSIASIINYDTYQPLPNDCEQQNGQQSDNSRTASEQRPNTPNKDNKGNKEKKVKKTTYSGDIQIVLDYLNDKKGSAYKDGSNILARLNSGGSVEDCLKIIDNKFKDPYFVDNPQHLNPVTLFRKSHWDKYLNDNGNKPVRIYSETTQNNLEVLREASDERRKNVQ